MAAPNLFAAMNATLLDSTPPSPYPGNYPGAGNGAQIYSYGDGGEFRVVGNSGLDSVVNWGAYAATTSGNISSAVR